MEPIGYMSTMNREVRAAESETRRAPAAEKLLGAANDLFYRRGIRAVGVDEVVKAAGVAKISLYRAYSSKDDLIVGYLRERDAAFWRVWDQAIGSASGPREQLRAALALLRDGIAEPEYRGCPFANFASEFPEREHAGRRVVETSKRELRRRLADICRAVGVRDPDGLADGLFLLIEGAFAASQTTVLGDGFASDALGWAADTLLESQICLVQADDH